MLPTSPPADRARELILGAVADKRESERLKRRARRRYEEARAFCLRVGIVFEEIMTEAKGGHGQGENGTD